MKSEDAEEQCVLYRTSWLVKNLSSQLLKLLNSIGVHNTIGKLFHNDTTLLVKKYFLRSYLTELLYNFYLLPLIATST